MRALAIVGLLAGCTIIIKEPPPPPPAVGLADLCSIRGEVASMPSAHLFFSVRVDRTVAGLDQHYARWMRKAALGLFAVGIRPARVVMIRADERPVGIQPLAAWGCDLDGLDLDPAAVLRHYATQPEPKPTPVGCATDPLVSAGDALTSLLTAYPPGLSGSSGRRVFGAAPDLALVVHLDSLARRSGFEEPACESARRLVGDAGWLAYADRRLDADRVVHWLFHTDEGVSRETFVERCRAVEGLPVGVLDLLEPSARLLYRPLRDAQRHAGLLAEDLSICQALAPSYEVEFFSTHLRRLASDLGTTINEAFFEEVVGGDASGAPSRGDG